MKMNEGNNIFKKIVKVPKKILQELYIFAFLSDEPSETNINFGD